MTVVWIRAQIECDDCGARFTVALDPARTPRAGWCLHDEAEDAVRGGLRVPQKGEIPITGDTSVQDGRMLCPACTRKADAEDDEATCFICGEPLVDGQMVIEDINEGTTHRACFGDDPDSFVDLETGDPIPPGQTPPAGWPYKRGEA